MQFALLSEGLYPDKIGGIQKHSFLLVQELARKGIYIDIYTHVHRSYEIDRHFSVELLPFIKLIAVPFRNSKVYFPGHFLYESWVRSKELNELVSASAKEYDFVYVQGFAGMSYLRNPLSGATSILNFHGLEMFQRAASLKIKAQHLIFRPFVEYCIRLADYSVSLGGRLTDILANLTDKEKILVTPIGVDTTWLCNDDTTLVKHEPRRYVFVGRYERRKGVQELHEALQRIGPRANFSFTFIGPVPEEEQLDLPHISYLGLIKDQEIIRTTLRKADVLVCPSWSEGMPTVILEGMSSACAIIATDVGATANLVSSKNGWLIPAGDVTALHHALQLASTIPLQELIAKKQESLRLVKSKYTWDKVVDLFLCQLQDLQSTEA